MNFCTGGLTASEGNVLVRGRFVCDDGWGQNEAEVVCRFVDLCLKLALLKFFPLQQSQTVRFCYTLLLSPDLLVTAEEARRQTRDTEMLLEATLAWTMSNVR